MLEAVKSSVYRYLLCLYLQEDLNKSNSTAGPSVDNGEMKLKLDFSGVVDHLDAEPAVTLKLPIMDPPAQTSLRKRKRVNYVELDEHMEVDSDVSSIGPDCLTSDHDYVTKKPKLTAVTVEDSAAAEIISTATVMEAPRRHDRQQPDGKYRERRDKNNQASRRSRQIRKQKYQEMDKEAEVLEVKNEELRKKIVELEALAKTMKAMLIKKMTEK